MSICPIERSLFGGRSHMKGFIVTQITTDEDFVPATAIGYYLVKGTTVELHFFDDQAPAPELVRATEKAAIENAIALRHLTGNNELPVAGWIHLD